MAEEHPAHHGLALHHLAAPFGVDRFGRGAERFARAFGTPRFIVAQTVVVVVWIALNALAFSFRWDPYPFILLNLAFSTQAAYAAPLILLAQTRAADRDKAWADADARHREELAQRTLEGQARTHELAERLGALLESDSRLTEEVERLTREIHARVVG